MKNLMLALIVSAAFVSTAATATGGKKRPPQILQTVTPVVITSAPDPL